MATYGAEKKRQSRARKKREPLPTDPDELRAYHAEACRAYRERCKERRAATAANRAAAAPRQHRVNRDFEPSVPRAPRPVCADCCDLPWRRPPDGCACCGRPFLAERKAHAESKLGSSAGMALLVP